MKSHHFLVQIVSGDVSPESSHHDHGQESGQEEDDDERVNDTEPVDL